jgi:hypothetical protein
MRIPRVVAIAIATFGSIAASREPRTQASLPVLLPGSADLAGTHFSARCDSMQRFGRAPGESTERALGAQRLTEQPTSYRGKPAILLVTSVESAQPFVDSTLMYRDGLAPISEIVRIGPRSTRYDYDGAHVRITRATGDSTPTAREHRYPTPVFPFQQLDAVIRSLPLRAGYAALLPLYSEGDDSVEVDSVRVEGRGANGVWTIRFADPAIVATVGIDGKSRAQVAYAHTFRQKGPSWDVGMVWRQTYARCGAEK